MSDRQDHSLTTDVSPLKILGLLESKLTSKIIFLISRILYKPCPIKLKNRVKVPDCEAWQLCLGEENAMAVGAKITTIPGGSLFGSLQGF